MPKRSVKGGSKHKKNVEFPKTPHGPVLGQGKKMKGGGILDRIPGALMSGAPQFLLGAATDNPYFMAQGASAMFGKLADNEDYDVLNRGAAGETTSALGQMRMWQGPQRVRRAPRRFSTKAEPRDILNVDDIGEFKPYKGSIAPTTRGMAREFDMNMEPSSAGRLTLGSRARNAAAAISSRARALGSRLSTSARGFASRSRQAIGQARDRFQVWNAKRKIRNVLLKDSLIDPDANPYYDDAYR